MATIRKVCEDALVAYLTAANISHEGVTPNVRAGRVPDDKTEPLIICTARDWQEDAAYLNWYRVRCTIETKVHANTAPPDLFDELCSQVRDALRVTDLGAELATVEPGLSIPPQGVSAEDKGEFTINDDVWIETREIELYCTQA